MDMYKGFSLCALKCWLQLKCEVGQRQKERYCASVYSPAGESHNAHNKPLWETGCMDYICRLNTGFAVLVVSATASGSFTPHFKILVVITKYFPTAAIWNVFLSPFP